MTREEQIVNACAKERSVSEERAFKKGAEWADTHPNWISVEDELPKCEMFKGFPVYPTVIICTEDGFRDTGYYNTNTKEWEEFENVTHWMPLPENPRKENVSDDTGRSKKCY